MTSGKEVKVFRSVDAIGRDSINSIATNGFYTYDLFKTLETQQFSNLSPVYFAVYDRAKLLAVAPCFRDLSDRYFRYTPRVMPFSHFDFGNTLIASALRKMLSFGHWIGFCQEHSLICEFPLCDRSEVVVGKNLDEELILSLLTEKIDEFCKRERFLFSAFLFVSEFDRFLMNNLWSTGYVQSSGFHTSFYIDIQWPNFEEYLLSLKYKTRKKVKREIKKCAENGITIEEPELGNLPAILSKLASSRLLKYYKVTRNIFDESFFSKLNEYARDRTKVFTAKKNNEIVGFSLCLRQGDVLNVWMNGFKYDVQSSTDFTYFNLCYYAPIRWAIEHGVKKMYYPRRMDEVKLIRGCKPEKQYSFVKCHDKVLEPLINSALKTPIFNLLESRFSRSQTLSA